MRQNAVYSEGCNRPGRRLRPRTGRGCML